MQSLNHPWCQTGHTLTCSLRLQMIHPWFQPPSLLNCLHMHVLQQVVQICTPITLDMCLLLKFYSYPKVSSPGHKQSESIWKQESWLIHLKSRQLKRADEERKNKQKGESKVASKNKESLRRNKPRRKSYCTELLEKLNELEWSNLFRVIRVIPFVWCPNLPNNWLPYRKL